MGLFPFRNLRKCASMIIPEGNYIWFFFSFSFWICSRRWGFIHFEMKQPFLTRSERREQNQNSWLLISIKLYASFKHVLAYNNTVINWIASIAINQCQRIMNEIERKINCLQANIGFSVHWHWIAHRILSIILVW